MTRGEAVMCINDEGLDCITRGKVYYRLSTGSGVGNTGFFIKNDSGVRMFYFRNRFIPLDEYRVLQLDKNDKV